MENTRGAVPAGRLGIVRTPAAPALSGSPSGLRLGYPGGPCAAPGYRRVYGQCIFDVPQGIAVLAGRGTVIQRR